MEPLRVFVSSTYDDLVAYREATRKAVAGLELFADDMASWSADDRQASRLSTDRVAQSDVVVLLIAHRYGHVPKGQDRSVTEIEYDAARSHDVPVLAFIVADSVSWPPGHIEWDARERLDAFKERVGSEVTRQLFQSPDDLAVKVSQALSLFAQRRSRPLKSDSVHTRFVGPVRREATASQIRTQPELLVEIGVAEDGLPLLLDVCRARDMQSLNWHFQALGTALTNSGIDLPPSRLTNFQQSVLQFADEASARTGLSTVRMTDGTRTELLVTPSNLTAMFSSALAGLLARSPSTMVPGGQRRPKADEQSGALATAAPVAHRYKDMRSSESPAALQSAGGRNRFLAVSPDDGRVYCVGTRDGEIVEWRSFVFEDVRILLPSAEFDLVVPRLPSSTYPLAEAAKSLAIRAQESDRIVQSALGTVRANRNDVLKAIALIADEAHSIHAGGRVHGDIKPPNVLLCEERPILIDDFGISEGDPAPGWTPGWSAPEQVLGHPVTAAADVYSLGMMINAALGGVLVGEVRQYRGLYGQRLRTFELFHDPAVVLAEESGVPPASASARAWRTLIERALRFDPSERIGTASDLAEMLRRLIRTHPLDGFLAFAPSGHLVRSRMVGGGDRIARVIEGGWPQRASTYGGYPAYPAPYPSGGWGSQSYESTQVVPPYG